MSTAANDSHAFISQTPAAGSKPKNMDQKRKEQPESEMMGMVMETGNGDGEWECERGIRNGNSRMGIVDLGIGNGNWEWWGGAMKGYREEKSRVLTFLGHCLIVF